MRLTEKLLGYLHRVFDKDPLPFVALRFTYAGSMTWVVNDGVLTTTVLATPAHDLTVDLTSHTLASLTAYLSTQTGYTVTYIDPARASLNARVLLDREGDSGTTNGDALFGYTSILWAFLEAWGVELSTARDQVAQMLLQMDLVDASGAWIDEIGGYYGVPRITGEADAAYGPRIIAEVIRPRSNNVAIEAAIETDTGYEATVTDVVGGGSATPIYDGSIVHDGAYTHSGGGVPIYGLFDVLVTVPTALPVPDAIGLANATYALVQTMRAAGTHPRNVVVDNEGTEFFYGVTDYLITEDGQNLVYEDGATIILTE